MSSPAIRTPDHLRTLLDAVTEARARVLDERASGNKVACLRARTGLIKAIEAYAAALAARGGALPHLLRAELNLCRALEQVP